MACPLHSTGPGTFHTTFGLVEMPGPEGLFWSRPMNIIHHYAALFLIAFHRILIQHYPTKSFNVWDILRYCQNLTQVCCNYRLYSCLACEKTNKDIYWDLSNDNRLWQRMTIWTCLDMFNILHLKWHVPSTALVLWCIADAPGTFHLFWQVCCCQQCPGEGRRKDEQIWFRMV